MSDRIVSADEARALLDGTTSGPWTYDPPNEQCPAWITQAHDPTEDVALIEDVLDVDGRLMASAPDLARSVEALHASESAAVARASRLALDLHAAQSEGAEARRDVRLRDETIEELRRTVREVSRACETLRERCERAENTHDAAAQAFDDLVARLWCAAIETTLRRRDPEATLWRYPTETDRALWVARPLRMEVTARGYGANADLDALRDLAILVGLRVTDCPACGGRGRRLYAREVEDGCDECECAGVVVIDPAEEVERLRAELAETERRLDAEISAMDARDGAYHALNGARDGSDELVALAECRMAEIKCLRAKLALERERCAGLVREIPACQPGAKATAARRWLDDRVAACVRAIEVDDEAATCARALVREARERAKAAEADVARLTRERDQMGAQQQRLMAMIGEQTAEVGRLHTDNASLDDVARAAIADIDAVRAELARVVAERDRLQRACDEGLPRERIDCPACGQMHVEGPRHDDPSVDGRTRPHHTHRCYHCGHVWDAGRWSFGVDAPHDPTFTIAQRYKVLVVAAREYLAAETAANAAHVGSMDLCGEFDSDEVDAAADRIVASIKAQDEARKSLRALIEVKP